MTITTQEQNNSVKKYNLFLLNNTRIEYNSITNDIIIWIYHDKNYKNGTYYRIDNNKNLYLCTTRADSFEEEQILW